MNEASHFDDDGNAHMVDVSAKPPSVRVAVASGQAKMSLSTADLIRGGGVKKGDVLTIARLAAISATKWTSSLVPLCHAIPIEGVSVDFTWPAADRLCLAVTVRTTAKTGVEMEAMTAVSIGLLTIYDMVKSVDRQVSIDSIRLEQKSGGKSGDFFRSGEPKSL